MNCGLIKINVEFRYKTENKVLKIKSTLFFYKNEKRLALKTNV